MSAPAAWLSSRTSRSARGPGRIGTSAASSIFSAAPSRVPSTRPASSSRATCGVTSFTRPPPCWTSPPRGPRARPAGCRRASTSRRPRPARPASRASSGRLSPTASNQFQLVEGQRSLGAEAVDRRRGDLQGDQPMLGRCGNRLGASPRLTEASASSYQRTPRQPAGWPAGNSRVFSSVLPLALQAHGVLRRSFAAGGPHPRQQVPVGLQVNGHLIDLAGTACAVEAVRRAVAASAAQSGPAARTAPAEAGRGTGRESVATVSYRAKKGKIVTQKGRSLQVQIAVRTFVATLRTGLEIFSQLV